MRSVPLQNRVTPTGEIVSDPGRGLMMGNRGCLHDPDRRLRVARWRSKLWICCVLSFKDVRRDPMPPGRWTALFFLDEATAFAAGHRPCAYCRRADYIAFTQAWQRAEGSEDRPRAYEMDKRLHTERVGSRSRRQVTRPATVGELPDGVMVRHRDGPGLLVGGQILPWSFDGYGAPVRVTAKTAVDLLTPPVTVATIAAGYEPWVHPTARAGTDAAVRLLDLPRETLQPNRGWTDEEWEAAQARLVERGWLDPAGTCTPEGRARHAAVEEATDLAAAMPYPNPIGLRTDGGNPGHAVRPEDHGHG